MYMLHGSCTNCGCSVHECECSERDNADAAFMEKLNAYLSALSEPKADAFACFDCLGPASAFMVHDSVWDAAWPNSKPQRRVMRRQAEERGLTKQARQLLCFDCFEKRLGRRLTIEDFTKVSLNDGVRIGYRMGSEPPTRG